MDYLRRHAPRLLEKAPKVLQVLQSAHMCAAWIRGGRSAADPQAKKWADFVQNRRREVNRGSRSYDDEVCRILREAIPDWLGPTGAMHVKHVVRARDIAFLKACLHPLAGSGSKPAAVGMLGTTGMVSTPMWCFFPCAIPALFLSHFCRYCM